MTKLQTAAAKPRRAGARARGKAWVLLILCLPVTLTAAAYGSEDMIYWTDWSSRVICRRGLNKDVGHVVVRVHAPNPDNKAELLRPGPIALNALEGKVYWISSSTFLRQGQVGSTLTLVGTTTSDQGVLQRANLDGSDVETVVTGLPWPFSLAVAPVGGKLYWCEDGDHATSVKARIRRANLDGTHIETLPIPLFSLRSRFAIGLSDQMLYHIMQTFVFRTNLDGTQREYPLISENHGLESSYRSGIVVDDAMQKFYWNWGTDVIYRANTDGTDIEEIGHDRITDLAMDQKNRKLYWVAWTGHYSREPLPLPHQYLRRANMDGSCIEELPLSYEIYPKVVVPHRSWIGGIALYAPPAESQEGEAATRANAYNARVAIIVTLCLIAVGASLFFLIRWMVQRRKSGRLKPITLLRYAAVSASLLVAAIWLITAIPWNKSCGYKYYYGRDRYVLEVSFGRITFRDDGLGARRLWPNGMGISRPEFDGTSWRDRFGLWPPFYEKTTGGAIYLTVPIWILFALLAMLAALIYWRDRPPRANHCPWCNYNLTGNTSGRCPACGHATLEAAP